MARQIALVTGATGFVGSHVARRLVANGWRTHLIVREKSKLDYLSDLKKNVSIHVHDGTTESMVRLVRRVRPDVVFHIAADGRSDHEVEDVIPLLQSNILFGTQLLEAMARSRVRYLVNTGTYWQHYNNKQYSPVSLHAAYKQAFEKIVQYYIETAGLRAITLVLFDTYGNADRRSKLLPMLLDARRRNRPLAMTRGEQQIQLVHIDDVVEAFVVAANRVRRQKGTGHNRFAVRSGPPIRVRDLVALVENVAHCRIPVRWGARRYRAREVMKPWTGGQQLPGWSARIGLRDGIARLLA